MKITKKGDGARRLSQAVRDIQSKQLRVGWGENIKYDDGTLVAEVAAQNEFGNPAKNIPPRPFMRPTINRQRSVWMKKAAHGIMSVLRGERTTGEVFDTIGQLAAGDIRKTISKVKSPPLKTATVMARLRGKKQGNSVSLTAAKPLVDTGHMLNSLSSEVVEK